MTYQIGKVCGVSGDEILVTVIDHKSDEHGESGVPDSMTVHLASDSGPLRFRRNLDKLIAQEQPGSLIPLTQQHTAEQKTEA